MPRPDPALLDAARYPFRYDIEPRFSDLDVNNHFNNIATLGLFQEARVRLHQNYAGWPDSRPYALIVASLSVEYLADGTYPATATIHSGIAKIGRTSHVVQQLLVQAGQSIAVSTAVMVRTGNGAPMENDPQFTQAMRQWQMKT